MNESSLLQGSNSKQYQKKNMTKMRRKTRQRMIWNVNKFHSITLRRKKDWVILLVFAAQARLLFKKKYNFLTLKRSNEVIAKCVYAKYRNMLMKTHGMNRRKKSELIDLATSYRWSYGAAQERWIENPHLIFVVFRSIERSSCLAASS